MKPKLIRQILRNKFEAFVKSIEDENLQKQVRAGTIITGGCIVSLLLNEKPNDYDLYFTSQQLVKDVAEYYVKQFTKNNPDLKYKNSDRQITPIVIVDDNASRVRIKIKSAGMVSESNSTDYQYFEGLDPESGQRDQFVADMLEILKAPCGKKDDKTFRPIFLTENAISLSSNIQLVIRFYGSSEEIHRYFDFVHCMSYYSTGDDKLVLPRDTLEAILTKQLVFVNSCYPICSLLRVRKFVQRGWTCNAGQILKMCFAVSELDLNDPKILHEQLVGVDIAYFYELINKLKDHNPEKVDYAYLVQLIDEIF